MTKTQNLEGSIADVGASSYWFLLGLGRLCTKLAALEVCGSRCIACLMMTLQVRKEIL